MRLSAINALNHSWFLCIKNIPRPLINDQKILKKLIKYNTQNKAMRICKKLFAHISKFTNYSELVELFFAFDPIFSGAITSEGLSKIFPSIQTNELQSNSIVFYFRYCTKI